jgi:hypothetical protein
MGLVSAVLSYINRKLTQVFHCIDQKTRLTKGLKTSSSITVPFTAEKHRILQHYMDRGESLKSRLKYTLIYPDGIMGFKHSSIVSAFPR